MQVRARMTPLRRIQQKLDELRLLRLVDTRGYEDICFFFILTIRCLLVSRAIADFPSVPVASVARLRSHCGFRPRAAASTEFLEMLALTHVERSERWFQNVKNVRRRNSSLSLHRILCEPALMTASHETSSCTVHADRGRNHGAGDGVAKCGTRVGRADPSEKKAEKILRIGWGR